MLPGGFKKDSRVWLHKNASRSVPKKASPLIGCDCERQHIGLGSDDPYECLPQDQCNSMEPLITDGSGRIYKKDSRTWLHKSSKKKLKTSRAGDLMEDIGSRMGWRQETRALSAGESPDGVIRTRSSTELIRAQSGTNKIKKKKTMMLMSMMMTPPAPAAIVGGGATPVPETKMHSSFCKYRPSVKRASDHDMPGTGKGCTTVSAFASDLCITGKRSPSRPAMPDDLADSDSDYNEMDDNDDEEMTMEEAHMRCRDCLDTENKGGADRRPRWNSSTVEVTRDGLRELEKMMKEQNEWRMAQMTKSLANRPGQTPGCDVSPESLSSDSRVSLDANINLSEEIMCGQGLNQSQNSAEQLTKATEYLHVCSPNRQTITPRR